MWWDGKHILSGTVIHAEDIRFLADTLPSHVPRQSRDACDRKVYELPKEGLDHVLSNLIMGEDEVEASVNVVVVEKMKVCLCPSCQILIH